jgi:predicted DNA-binding ribbon-helix-helix protein
MVYPKKVKEGKRITVTLDRYQYDAIMELARRNRKAFADIVRAIIDEYLKNHNLIDNLIAQ